MRNSPLIIGVMPNATLNPHLQRLVGTGTGSEVAELFALWLPSRLARLLARLARSEQRALLRKLPRKRAVAALCCLAPEIRARLLDAHTDQELRELLGGIRPLRQRLVLRQLPVNTALRLCRLLGWQGRRPIVMAQPVAQTAAIVSSLLLLLPGGPPPG